MNYEELRKNAQAVIENTPSGNFTDKSFSCSSGGAPVNRCGVKILTSNEDFAYDTTANGAAYRGEVVVRCRPTPANDVKGRAVYEDEEGTVFVFTYGKGDASSFDSGSLRTPELMN